jgi:hypothetical protein
VLVLELQLEGARRVVLDADAHLGLRADVEAPAELAEDFEPRGQAARARVEEGRRQHARVEAERQPPPPRPPPRERQRHEPQREQRVEEFCEDETHRFPGNAPGFLKDFFSCLPAARMLIVKVSRS